MKRVWLSISLVVVSLAGSPWLSNPARSDENSPYPGVDTSSEGHGDCPSMEKMRAYGECHWYEDQEYQRGTECEIVPDEPMADETVAPESDVAEAASGVEPAIASPMPSAVVGPTDCWYDCETDAYYHYEFSGAEAAASKDSLTEEVSSCDADAYADESCVESEYEEYADSEYEMDASNSVEDQADAETQFTEDSEEAMESTMDATESTTPVAETPATWPSREYDYKYGGYPYEYESYEPAYIEPTYSEPGYNEPVQAWEDADVEVVEGEGDEESVPPAPASDLTEFDTEVILSLARTLDRVGSTLQSLSRHLTEMATNDLAGHHGETLHR